MDGPSGADYRKYCTELVGSTLSARLRPRAAAPEQYLTAEVTGCNFINGVPVHDLTLPEHDLSVSWVLGTVCYRIVHRPEAPPSAPAESATAEQECQQSYCVKIAQPPPALLENGFSVSIIRPESLEMSMFWPAVKGELVLRILSNGETWQDFGWADQVSFERCFATQLAEATQCFVARRLNKVQVMSCNGLLCDAQSSVIQAETLRARLTDVVQTIVQEEECNSANPTDRLLEHVLPQLCKVRVLHVMCKVQMLRVLCKV